ncbi:hypothetical protein [Ancylomarina longa]|uniref:Tetratricopeptide repeat protein n=1 Tax=Ancylomarina longa TaxID=2487017 RepID=A0A434B004_9BACT|nr:hypothetical protein [Ancylomarina longa]RUT80170.1 hypothetical protein DLK05_02125 [Ancylomarina longa]
MYQKDFILRMLEMIADLVAAILGLIKNGHTGQASQILENAYRDFLKEDASFFREIPIEKLTTKLLQEHNYQNAHLEILSELFFAEGELQFARGNQKSSLIYYKKTLLLIEFVEKESHTYSFRKQDKIISLQEKISALTRSLG